MQIRWSRLLFLAVLLGSAAFWYFGGVAELEVKLTGLATQPHVNTAFQDPITGQSDAHGLPSSVVCLGESLRESLAVIGEVLFDKLDDLSCRSHSLIASRRPNDLA